MSASSVLRFDPQLLPEPAKPLSSLWLLSVLLLLLLLLLSPFGVVSLGAAADAAAVTDDDNEDDDDDDEIEGANLRRQNPRDTPPSSSVEVGVAGERTGEIQSSTLIHASCLASRRRFCVDDRTCLSADPRPGWGDGEA